jgi:hypothetical protein
VSGASYWKGRKMSAETKAKIAAANTRPLAERFWEKVEKTETCWIWTAAKMPQGYGRIGLKSRSYLAHVWSLRLAGIEVPKGMYVDHICRNRSCVRPDHLRIVAPGVNATENNESPLARNRRKTHCVRGHAFTPENTIIYTPKSRVIFGRERKKSYPQRQCLACRVIRAREATAKKQKSQSVERNQS